MDAQVSIINISADHITISLDLRIRDGDQSCQIFKRMQHWTVALQAVGCMSPQKAERCVDLPSGTAYYLHDLIVPRAYSRSLSNKRRSESTHTRHAFMRICGSEKEGDSLRCLTSTNNIRLGDFSTCYQPYRTANQCRCVRIQQKLLYVDNAHCENFYPKLTIFLTACHYD